MKKIFVFIFILVFTCADKTLAETPQTPANAQFYSDAQPVAVDYSQCIKDYSMSSTELFHRTMAAISASNYKIIEIQSKSSRILFSVFGCEFWASVTKQSSAASTLRILPADNSFYFRKDLIDRVFNEIDTYKSEKVMQVVK